jgi:hypothetical protein
LYARQLRIWDGSDRWIGYLFAFTSENGYATPREDQRYQFGFSNLTAVSTGDTVLFDIVQGNYALKAGNVRRA